MFKLENSDPVCASGLGAGAPALAALAAMKMAWVGEFYPPILDKQSAAIEGTTSNE